MEKKYIEISEAIEYFRMNQGRDGYKWGDIAICLQQSISAADVVPVVRCRDCKFAHLTHDGEVKRCDEWNEIDELYLSGDFFCASGQRRA